MLKIRRLLSSIHVLFLGMLYTIGILRRTDRRNRFRLTKDVKSQFEHEYSIYDASRDAWVHGYLGKAEESSITKHLKGNSVLELGIGTGRVMTRFARKYSYYGVDLSYQMLKRAKDKTGIEKLDVELLVADGEHLGFRHNVFDNVICSRTIKYVSHPLKALSEVKRVLRTDGRCIITCETSDSIWHRVLARGSGNLTDIRFNVSELVSLLSNAGFKIVCIIPIRSLLSPYYGPHKVVRMLDTLLSRIRMSTWMVIGESNSISFGTTNLSKDG